MDPYVCFFWFIFSLLILLPVAWWVAGGKARGPRAVGTAQTPPSARIRFTAPVAAAFGIAGAFLLATKVPPALGFGAFLVSNVGWIVVSCRTRAWSLLVQQLCFLVASVIGLWNWGLGPLLLG